MPSDITDIVGGRSGSVAVKAPCRIVTTTNHSLSGLSAIDGVTPADGDRVLVMAQSDARQNGIYRASSGLWQRAPDFDGSRDVVQGTMVPIAGTGAVYRLTTADPVTIGTSSLSFALEIRTMAGRNIYISSGGLTTGGGATAYTVTTNQGLATPADGVMIHIVPHASNTGAATLNVDGTGAKALRRVTASGDAALAAGAMLKDGHYLLAYDASANSAAGAWIVLNPESSVASVTVTGAGLATGGGDLTANRVITVTAAAGADVAAGTATDKAITPDAILDAMAWVTLTYASTMTIDHREGVNRKVTLTDNGAFGAPSNARVGWPLNIWIVQDGTGSRVPTWNAAFDFGDADPPTLSTGAGEADLVTFVCLASDKFVYLGTRLRVD